MNDTLKYYPITFDYEGEPMSIPMGEIIAIEKMTDVCRIHTRGDSWTSESTTYDDVMAQWKKAFNSLGSGLYL